MTRIRRRRAPLFHRFRRCLIVASRISKASRRPVGGSLEASGDLFWGLLGPLLGLLGASWGPLGASWVPFGAES